MKPTLAITLLAALTFCVAAPAKGSECLDKAVAAMQSSSSTAHAFDFYEGTWRIHMRQRHIGEDLRVLSAWSAFDATVSVRKVLQGTGFLEEYRMAKPDGVKYAIGTRLYDPKSNAWAIYWANKDEGQWQPPARGGIMTSDGIDVIYDDTWGSRAVLTRYRWITKDPGHPTWEQSLSGDCGATWVSNWTMEFTRSEQK